MSMFDEAYKLPIAKILSTYFKKVGIYAGDVVTEWTSQVQAAWEDFATKESIKFSPGVAPTWLELPIVTIQKIWTAVGDDVIYADKAVEAEVATVASTIVTDVEAKVEVIKEDASELVKKVEAIAPAADSTISKVITEVETQLGTVVGAVESALGIHHDNATVTSISGVSSTPSVNIAAGPK